MLFHTVNHPMLTDKLTELKIVPISDTHIGDPNFDEKKLMEKIREIKESENTLALLNGDIVNNGIKSSISNCYEEVLRPSEQVKYAVKLFNPIKDKVIGAVEGNHERRTTKEVDQSPCERYCERLGIQYFSTEVFLKLRFGKSGAEGSPIYYGGFMTHGTGGGRTVGGKVNMLSRMADVVIADFYIMSHTHQLAPHPEVIYIPDLRENKIREQELWLVMSGSYLKRGGYAGEKIYSPVKLGSPTITLGGKRKEISVTI